MSSNNIESAFKSLPFKKLQIEEEKEETIHFEVEEDEYLKQPGALIIPLNIPNPNEQATISSAKISQNQQISLPLVFADNAFSTVVIEKEENPKSPGNASLEIEDESENDSQNHHKSCYAPSPQVSSGSPAYPEKVYPQLSAALKQPQCFLNIDIPSDKQVEVASQAESSDKQDSSQGTHKDKSESTTKMNLQNSTTSSKKQISPFIVVKTLLMKKSPFMHLTKNKKKNNATLTTHTNMQMCSGSTSKYSEPPSGPAMPAMDDIEM